jgi:hypothetical protein
MRQNKNFKTFATIIDLTFRRYMELNIKPIKRSGEASCSDRVRAEIASMRTIADRRITY